MAEHPGSPRRGAAGHSSLLSRALDRSLDLLPWPWGEEAMAALALVRGVADSTRRRRALRWAAQYRSGVAARWRLALALFANEGRDKAANALLGIRDPAHLRAHLVIEGEEHLRVIAEGGPVIVAGFHFGLSLAGVALKTAGYPLTTVLGWGRAERNDRVRSRLGFGPGAAITLPTGNAGESAAHLNATRRLLLEGRAVFITADGRRGNEAFRIDVPGGSVVVRSGWLTLRRLTKAVTLPVLARRDGRRVIVTVHPPLPAPDPDAARDVETSRQVLGPILLDYARRFPEHCRTLALGPPPPLRPSGARQE